MEWGALRGKEMPPLPHFLGHLLNKGLSKGHRDRAQSRAHT